MRKFLIVFALFLASQTDVYAQERMIKVFSPKEVSAEVTKSQGIPKDLEGLSWNRWTSKNFVVCSLNDPQAQYLHKHLELVKKWTFTRWGMYDADFSVQCKLICVDSKDLFKRLFNLDDTKVEIRRDSDGRIVETVIFLLIDGSPSDTVPIPLTEICLAELSQKYNSNFGLWIYKGVSYINGTLEQIREHILVTEKSMEDFSSIKNLFETSNEQYKKLTDSQKKSFDNLSTTICLFIRKEFGQESFLKFIQVSSESSAEEAIKTVLGFAGYDDFTNTFKRYVKDLSREVSSGKTPDFYLQIKEKNN
jgi:hypothetical protein